MPEIVDKNGFKIGTLPNNLVLICRFEDHNLMSSLLYSVLFVIYMFSAKIWVVKTSLRIVKYESRVVKSNPDIYFLFIRICNNILCVCNLVFISSCIINV